MHAQESVAALGSVAPSRPDEFPEDRPAPEATPPLRILILNGDLPIFPGWGGVEHLHTLREELTIKGFSGLFRKT